MKKLLVLLAILAMASTANASLTIVSPAEVMKGDTVEVTLNVLGEKALLTGALVFEGPVSVDASGATVPALSIDSNFILEMIDNPDLVAFLNDLGIAPVSALYYEVVHLAGNPASIPDGVMFGNIMMTGLDQGDGMISLVDMGSGEVIGTQPFKVIPEPMTIALLGLGGLFLRRRK